MRKTEIHDTWCLRKEQAKKINEYITQNNKNFAVTNKMQTRNMIETHRKSCEKEKPPKTCVFGG